MIDKVFVVYENSDMTEGRGPMVQVHDSGFFLDETEAWKFADTRRGVMGRCPQSGTWRQETFGDVTVKVIYAHSEINTIKKREIHKQIKELEKKLAAL
jgi:phospholipase C